MVPYRQRHDSHIHTPSKQFLVKIDNPETRDKPRNRNRAALEETMVTYVRLEIQYTNGNVDDGSDYGYLEE